MSFQLDTFESELIEPELLKRFGSMNVGYLTHLVAEGRQASEPSGEESDNSDSKNIVADGSSAAIHSQTASKTLLSDRSAPRAATRKGSENGSMSSSQALRVGRLINAIRRDGHHAATIDPLGIRPIRVDHLHPERYGVLDSTLEQPADWLGVAHDGILPWLAVNTIGEALNELKRHYCGSIGYEFDHIHNVEERMWLLNQVESQSSMVYMSDTQKRYLLELLTRAETFEQFLHATFPGKRWYGLDGLEALISLIDQIILQSAFEVDEIVMGMAHRGRLNVLAHVLGQPYRQLLMGFLEGRFAHLAEMEASGWMTDVKYHLGSRAGRDIDLDGNTDIHLWLLPNPSHLEMVMPVVLGAVRSLQDNSPPTKDPGLAAMGLLIHGDAAFAGQGLVSESLNLTNLEGYDVGGAIHIIANNQLGFTTQPYEAYSGQYASDIARGYEVPVVHVNGDDLEACILAAKLAVAYRVKFRKDFVIDLVGYRRSGHNENDDPTFTQPTMYKAIAEHPTLRQQWADRLISEEIVTQSEADDMVLLTMDKLRDVTRGIEESGELQHHDAPSDLGLNPEPVPDIKYPKTVVSAERLIELNQRITSLPSGFNPHPNIKRVLERRREGLDGDDARIDWAHAESLAIGSILQDGVGVRLTGQDCERGTFSQRHTVVRDVNTGERFCSLSEIDGSSFWIYNSPLSESGPLGFEHGYSVVSDNTLVIWEAQFGDFANNAQSIIDEMIVSAYEKWNQLSNLTLLLPHGYEGQGPNHSHAYIERFLSLASHRNIRVAYPTTSAQYFHLLRTEAESLKNRESAKPLIVMTPKSLLRHPMASCSLHDLTEGEFRPIRKFVFSDSSPDEVNRVVLCSGKIFVDLASHPEVRRSKDAGVIVIEELYPFPDALLADALTAFPNRQEVVWLQEEPMNRGAWGFVRDPITKMTGQPVEYLGRPPSASPASGSNWLHRLQQDRLIRSAIGQDADD